MDNIVNQLAEQLASSSNAVVEQAVEIAVKKQLASLDIKALVRETAEKMLKPNMEVMAFPDNSIPITALNFKDFVLNGNQVVGGIHAEFGSTGIDDQATDCILTIMDDYVVVENHLITPSATIKESLVVEGDLIVKGNINTDNKGFQTLVEQAVEKTKKDIIGGLIESSSNATLDKLKSQELEVSKLTINGKPVIDDNGLHKTITKSNLQRLGVLNELQVKGETQINETLYVTKTRVGVNTTEPSAALAVWDEECELVSKKFEKNTGYLGSIRNQKIVLGSNNNVNIVLDVDGSTKIINLQVGNTRINSTDSMPGWSGKPGDLYFNEEPAIGKPMGWVCLGGERWAQLPKITE